MFRVKKSENNENVKNDLKKMEKVDIVSMLKAILARMMMFADKSTDETPYIAKAEILFDHMLNDATAFCNASLGEDDRTERRRRSSDIKSYMTE